mmetsp:Transcript_12598/g.27261  ORF Transcript_12598/g.27261 Transcript_12598/m.27261 type:complete len:119 (+) Transcript_12598:76-432(+)
MAAINKNTSLSLLVVCKCLRKLVLIILRDRDVPPDNSKDRPSEGHPHDTDSGWDTSGVLSEMKLGKQETKCRGLHRGLNSHCAGRGLSESSRTGKKVSNKTANKVQEKDGDLKAPASV